MIEKPLISIIIPIYKVEDYLERCLETVTKQTYHNLEIILVDDGSPDSCPQLCDKWSKKDERIVVVHQKNGGLSRARNVGLGIAKGNYIGFVDSDDWIELDMYEHLYSCIEKNNSDVAFCNFDRGSHKGRKKEVIVVKRNNEVMEDFFRVNGGKSNYAVWRGLYSSSVIKGIDFIEDCINEDVFYQYKVMKRCNNVVYSNQIKYHYFLNEDGITMRAVNKKDYSLFKIWDLILVEEKNTLYYEYALMNRMRVPFTLYCKYLKYGSDNISKNEIENWKEEIKENFHYLIKGNFLDLKRKMLLVLIKCL